MAYVTRAEIETEIPAAYLAEALDDDRDGVEDAGLFDALVSSASQAVDGLLGMRYSVPFVATVPSAVREAAFAFLGEKVYARREMVEGNPFTKRANFWRERLADIGKGTGSIDASTASVAGHGAAVTENSVIDGTTR